MYLRTISLLTAAFLFSCYQTTYSQENSSPASTAESAAKTASASNPGKQEQGNALLTVTDVGDPATFGNNVKYMGLATTGQVFIYSSCSPSVLLTDLDITLGPDDRCLELPVLGNIASASFTDIGRINLPKKATQNIVYFLQSNFTSYNLVNPTANQVVSTMFVTPTYTIESDALNDPAAIDPSSGLPMNGSYTVTGIGSRVIQRTYEANALEVINERSGITGLGGISKAFFTDLGLPQSIVNDLFKKPMTIKLNLRVRANYLTYGRFFYSVRFMGD
jgi:hypothetical protein